MKKNVKFFCLLLLITANIFIFCSASTALAQDLTKGLNITANAAGIPTSDKVNPLTDMIGNIIKWALGILGVVFLILIIIGGYLWMTAAGNEEKVRKAKMLIGAAISGIFIIFISYALAGAIIEALIQASS